MASSESSAKRICFETAETAPDLISSMPSLVTERIMKGLPITMAAKMSVLSRKWRHNWLSHRYLIFDFAFCNRYKRKGEMCHWRKISDIISNILFLHNGPVQTFHFYVPKVLEVKDVSLRLSQWLSCILRIGVKKIFINNSDNISNIPIPSHIYACKELVKLVLHHCIMMPLPCEFKGFAHLQSLKLASIKCKHDIFSRLIASCPRLTRLELENCITGMINPVVINATSLEKLTVRGVSVSLAFRNIPHLTSISLCLLKSNMNIVNTLKTLASSCELQDLHFGGLFYNENKLFAADCITKLDTLAFNHLHTLSLGQVDLGDCGVACFTSRLLQSCSFIKYLQISVIRNRSDVKHKFEYDENHTFRHLLKVEIRDITGSSEELKLIEYILTASVVLEQLKFDCYNLYPSSELKVFQKLLRLRRASSKARLVSLEQWRIEESTFSNH